MHSDTIPCAPPTRVTARTLTTAQILSLEAEAGSAGDHSLVYTCCQALGAVDSSATAAERRRLVRAARARVVSVLRGEVGCAS
jgi:hypothetical protein